MAPAAESSARPTRMRQPTAKAAQSKKLNMARTSRRVVKPARRIHSTTRVKHPSPSPLRETKLERVDSHGSQIPLTATNQLHTISTTHAESTSSEPEIDIDEVDEWRSALRSKWTCNVLDCPNHSRGGCCYWRETNVAVSHYPLGGEDLEIWAEGVTTGDFTMVEPSRTVFLKLYRAQTDLWDSEWPLTHVRIRRFLASCATEDVWHGLDNDLIEMREQWFEHGWDVDDVQDITMEQWREMGLKMGQLAKIKRSYWGWIGKYASHEY